MQSVKKESLGLVSDFYQFTMAYGYWKLGRANEQAVFNLFARKNPFLGQYTVAAGLSRVISFLENFSFSGSELEFLESFKTAQGDKVFSNDFLDYLKNLTFSCSLKAFSSS